MIIFALRKIIFRLCQETLANDLNFVDLLITGNEIAFSCAQ